MPYPPELGHARAHKLSWIGPCGWAAVTGSLCSYGRYSCCSQHACHHSACAECCTHQPPEHNHTINNTQRRVTQRHPVISLDCSSISSQMHAGNAYHLSMPPRKAYENVCLFLQMVGWSVSVQLCMCAESVELHAQPAEPDLTI